MSTPAKLGSTILVEAIGSYPQYTPSIAALANGQFVVGWPDLFVPTSGSFSVYGIRGQYFNANGDASGNPFGIYTPDGAFRGEGAAVPDLIGLAGGGFSAIYDWFSEGQDFFHWIFLSDFSGTTGTTFNAVNPETGSGGENPHQAQLTNGSIVVVWEQLDAIIYADIVTIDGTPLIANPIIAGIAGGSAPSVAALAGGGFVVVWQDDTNSSVWMQRYDASGNALGTNTRVPAFNSGTQSAPAVAGLPDGQYVIAYVDTSGAYSGDTSGSAIVARVFNADGSAVTDFLVNTTSSGDQTEPAVVALADGRFFVAWVDASGAGGAGTDIRGQLFESNGSGGYVKDGSELLIDTPGGNQDTPSLSVTPDGRILVSWQTTIAAGSGIDVQMLDPREQGMTFDATVASEQFYGTAYNDVLYADADTIFTGGGGFDTVIETAPGVTINVGAGTTLYQVQEVILGGGANVVNGSYSSDFVYFYGGGSGSTNTMTLGSGGGYEVANGGINHMFGGTGATATDVFIGGIGTSDMHGGSGNNLYYMGAADSVAGAGVYNTVIQQVSAGVNWSFGNNDIQQVILGFGTNVVDMTGSTDFVTIIGGNYDSFNTMSLGAGGGNIISAGGTNHMFGGGGTSVFIGNKEYNSIPTRPSDMHGGSGNNVYYTGAGDTVFGAGTYNTEILLDPDVTLTYGINLTDVQQVILNGGTNSIDMTGSSDSDIVYGGSGINTMTLGAGGGYEISTGGTNHMFASAYGIHVFVGGVGTSDMHGNGQDLFYVGANDTVDASGYGVVVELQQSVNVVLGSSQLAGAIYELYLNGGTNTVDTAVGSYELLHGGVGDDTLIGRGGGTMWGGGGANTFEFMTNSSYTIADWGAGSGNVIDLTAFAGQGIHSLADITQAISGGSETLLVGSSSYALSGVGTALGASSFHFA